MTNRGLVFGSGYGWAFVLLWLFLASKEDLLADYVNVFEDCIAIHYFLFASVLQKDWNNKINFVNLKYIN